MKHVRLQMSAGSWGPGSLTPAPAGGGSTPPSRHRSAPALSRPQPLSISETTSGEQGSAPRHLPVDFEKNVECVCECVVCICVLCVV